MASGLRAIASFVNSFNNDPKIFQSTTHRKEIKLASDELWLTDIEYSIDRSIDRLTHATCMKAVSMI